MKLREAMVAELSQGINAGSIVPQHRPVALYGGAHPAASAGLQVTADAHRQDERIDPRHGTA
jgi:hypothetical protein